MAENGPIDGARRSDALAAVAVLAISGVALGAAWREPPPHYDPLGPGTLPMAVAATLLILGLALLFRALLGLRIGHAAQSLIGGLDAGDAALDYELRPKLAIFAYVATTVYVASIALEMPFFWSTFAFLAGLGTVMARLRWPLTVWVFGASFAGTIAVDYLFRTLLQVALP